MKATEFCYWLQGYFEITKLEPGDGFLDNDQIECIRKHLQLVFIHDIDPSYPKEQQAQLNETHDSLPWSKPGMRC